ncbi:MAG: hypothetical protein KA792_02660, partial [Bacteroidales bacterium]|nr:hypothetical protein [Bacteroidales bacterium]
DIRPLPPKDGSKLQEAWFPQIEADVFISHSNKDEDKAIAIAIAGWLHKKLGLKPFIDSSIWGNSEDLIQEVCDAFSVKNSYSIDNFTCKMITDINKITKSVNMILSNAINKMIDNTECFLLINTANSINAIDLITRTDWPWLYNEITMSEIIRKKIPDRIRKRLDLIVEQKYLMFLPKIEFTENFEELIKLNTIDLKNWEEKKQESGDSKNSLDILYELKNKTN